MNDSEVRWEGFEQQPPAEVLLALRIELMTSTTVVRGFTDLIEMSGEGSLSEPPQEWVAAMRRATDQMRWLLDVVMLPLIKRLMPDDEPRRDMIEAMIRQSLGRESS